MMEAKYRENGTKKEEIEKMEMENGGMTRV